MIKQKILHEYTAHALKTSINQALQLGWLVQNIAVDSSSNNWIAVLYKNE